MFFVPDKYLQTLHVLFWERERKKTEKIYKYDCDIFFFGGKMLKKKQRNYNLDRHSQRVEMKQILKRGPVFASTSAQVLSSLRMRSNWIIQIPIPMDSVKLISIKMLLRAPISNQVINMLRVRKDCHDLRVHDNSIPSITIKPNCSCHWWTPHLLVVCRRISCCAKGSLWC